MQFSPQQSDVFDWVTSGQGSAFIEAVAGAGKTTTIIEACKAMRGSVAFAAYNKKIAEEISNKAADNGFGSRVQVGTFHSFGFRSWRKIAPSLKLDARGKQDFITTELLIPDELASFVHKLVSLAKNSAIGLYGHPDNVSVWWDIVDHHDLVEQLEDPRDAAYGINFARLALAKSREIAHELIDFDDMVYMPVVTRCSVWQNDWLLVDEAQDINPARLALARKMLRPRGRAVFVGDSRQAIYGFTGADARAVETIIREFRCTRLPLTVTYRCPRSVVALARDYVSHIEAHATAPQGAVTHAHEDDLPSMALGPSDAILCRLTAPLVKMAFKLIKAGIGCHVEGRDIGAGLMALAERWSRVETVEDLREKLEDYCERQVEKLTAKGLEIKAEAVQDRVDTLQVLLDRCTTLDDLKVQIKTLFPTDGDGLHLSLTLSTVHKSKGREWDRVFVLGFEKFMPSRFARQEWQVEQEHNLIYVAFTRAMRELVIVDVGASRAPASDPPAPVDLASLDTKITPA